MKEKFIEFLKDNNVYGVFCYNIIEYQLSKYNNFCNSLTAEQVKLFIEDWAETLHRTEIIARAFIWCDTDEGEKFWKELHKKWIKCTKN